MARLTISFKNTEKDNELYYYWMAIEDRSAEIKPLLRAEMEKRLKNHKNVSEEKTEEKTINIMDF